MTRLTRKDFYFDLPEHLVAHNALEQRDASRMLVRNNSGILEDRIVSELPDLLPRNSLLILNNTKVFPSRLVGYLESGGKAEIFLLETKENLNNSSKWVGLGKPFRKFSSGKRLYFADGLVAEICDIQESDSANPTLTLAFNLNSADMHLWLEKNGIIPLPPYIKREQVLPAALSPDSSRYQTTYAQDVGSVAAPTAGLHLTTALLSTLKNSGIEIVTTCLHVGAGTFLPVKTETISEHKMHLEKFYVPDQTLRSIQAAKTSGRPIVAVGTTSFRSIESLARKDPSFLKAAATDLGDKWHETDLFIFPTKKSDRYKSLVFDGIVTNFHQPESTLLMLISALIGVDEVMETYRWAIDRKYRFYSYGDCSLLWF